MSSVEGESGSGHWHLARLIATKLHRPEIRRAVVERPELLARLSDADARVTLVVAPPGWGKTTLLASWQRSQPQRGFAWVSLDPTDNDPIRFWAYVSASVAAATHAADPLQAVFALPAVDVENDILPALINHWAGMRSRVLLVLDDYHVIDAPEVDGELARLVDALPRQVRLAVASRREPGLPLGRWRARGQLEEVRVEDLALTTEQTARLLNGILGLSLEPRQISRIHDRTEGWPVALQLAALSWRGRIVDESVLEEYSGADRNLVDYLAAEVLAVQPASVRRFLLDTSMLRRMRGDLCDAVTGSRRSYAVLESLERSGLPVVPLDAERSWYRYHQLFAELLQRELARSEPARMAELHARAAGWFEREGMIADAIEHLLAAGGDTEADRAAALVARHWVEYFNRGLRRTVDGWLAALPPEAWMRHPELLLSRVWIALDTGRLSEVGHWVELAQELGAAGEHVVELLLAMERFKSGDIPAARARIIAAGNADASIGSFYQAVGSCLRGLLAFWSGEPAEDAFVESARTARAGNNELGELYAVGYLAVLAAGEGRSSRVTRLLRRADALADGDAAMHYVAVAAGLARTLVLEQGSELKAARDAVFMALRAARGGSGAVEMVGILATVARLCLATGDVAAARTAVAEARAVMDGCRDVGLAGEWLTAVTRRLEGRGTLAEAKAGDELSERELEVLRLLPRRLSVKGLSDRLFLSPNTVKTHLRNIFRKLGVSSRDAAIAAGRSKGLL